MLQNKLRIAFVAFTLTIIHLGQAQEADSSNAQLVRVNLKNAEVYVGNIISQDATHLVIKTAGGEISVPTTRIQSVDYLEQVPDSRFRFPNPNKTRYFFAPTAIPLRRGEGFYQNVLLSSNFVNYGITSNFSVGGGLELISTFMGSPVWFITPKVGYEVADKIHAGGGVFAIIPSGGQDFFVPFGNVTFGKAESNMTITLGVPVFGGAVTGPVFSIAVFHRLNTALALLSENYFIRGSTDGPTLFGVQGIRIIGRKNSIDVGIILTEFTPFPYVGFQRKF